MKTHQDTITPQADIRCLTFAQHPVVINPQCKRANENWNRDGARLAEQRLGATVVRAFQFRKKRSLFSNLSQALILSRNSSRAHERL